MKKDTQNLLLLGAAAAGGYFLYKKMTENKPPSTAGVPGIGATMPNWGLVPASMRGQPSPLWLDAALWGGLGTALGYWGLAGKKFKLLS